MKYDERLYQISLDTILLKNKLLNEVEELKKEVLNILIERFRKEYENEELNGLSALRKEVLTLTFIAGEQEFIKIDKLKEIGIFDSFAANYCFFLKEENEPSKKYIIIWDYKTYFTNISNLSIEKPKHLIK